MGKENGLIKLLVFREKTTQRPIFPVKLSPPINQKLGVIRTLLDRCNSVVTEEADKEKEIAHIEQALKQCGYPAWSFKKAKDQREHHKTKEKGQKTENSKAMVVIPYVQGVSEKVNSLFRQYNITTAIRPHTTLRKVLVQPKDKVDDREKTACVCKIHVKHAISHK